jgi:hypothetical protein
LFCTTQGDVAMSNTRGLDWQGEFAPELGPVAALRLRIGAVFSSSSRKR